MQRPRRAAVLALVALLSGAALWGGMALRRPASKSEITYPPQSLVVAFLNVGHGEAAWVKTPDGRFLVIGTGPAEAAEHLIASLRTAGAKKVDLLVLPYPYHEALGGTQALVNALPIKAALDTGWEQVNQHQKAALDALRRQSIPTQVARVGQAFDLGNGGKLEVLFPTEAPVAQTPAGANNAIVLRLHWGSTAFLWEGGLERAGEQALLSLGQELTADVLRTARFANAGASSPELLREVSPRFVVVSVGENSSGLPDKTTLERLDATGARVLRTDQEKRDLLFFSDGVRVSRIEGP